MKVTVPIRLFYPQRYAFKARSSLPTPEWDPLCLAQSQNAKPTCQSVSKYLLF